jgi:hypothetical protein
MQTKVFEIRDRATFLVGLAVKLRAQPETFVEDFLLGRAGFGEDSDLIILMNPTYPQKAEWDAYARTDRTWRIAHMYIQHNWQHLKSGDVIDVEFILKETTTKKESERENESSPISN